MPSVYQVKSGNTIYDIAMATYGSVAFVYKILQDNPAITSLDFDFASNPGQMIIWNEALKVKAVAVYVPPEKRQENNIKTYIARSGQSLYDVCLQTYGSIDFIYKLITDNQIDNLNTYNLGRKQFIFDASLIADVSINQKNEDGNIFYATATNAFNPSLREDFSYDLGEDGTIELEENPL